MWAAENETLARIGSQCLQQFIENNAGKLTDETWGKIVGTFTRLFDVTTPHSLFDPKLIEDDAEEDGAFPTLRKNGVLKINFNSTCPSSKI